MILKKNIHEVYDEFLDGMNNLNDIQKEIKEIKEDLYKKVAILSNEYEYAHYSIKNLTFIEEINKNYVSLTENAIFTDTFVSYGNIVHPTPLALPKNVLNFITSEGAFYVKGSTVKINDKENIEFESILYHDSLDKGIAFEEFDNRMLKLEIVLDTSNFLSSNNTNMIELCPFLAGSFSIDSIEIYTSQSQLTKSETPDFVTSMPMQNVGPCRIVLDKKYDIARIVFNIVINYINKNGKYPFGLKHIYFFNANFNKDSYGIAIYKTNSNINFISEDVLIHTLFSKQETTCSEYGIELYELYKDGVFERPIIPSNIHEINIASNIKEFYIKIPLHTSLYGISFKRILVQ